MARESLDLPQGPLEHSLLLAATNVTIPRHLIERALCSSPDWTRVMILAVKHRLTPALLHALEAADPVLVPSDLMAALREHCHRLHQQNLAILTELFELLAALSALSIPVVPFKGPLLGELLFGDAAMRYPGDVDLLLRGEDVSTVCELLEARGYEDAGRGSAAPPLSATQLQMYRRFQCEHTYVRDADGVVVEPHWALSQYPLALDIEYRGMFGRARPVNLHGGTVLCLVPEDLLLALCIHGGKHHWSRLAWIRDVGALLTRFPDLDVERCVEQARAAGCLRLLLVGLTLARRCAAVRVQAPLQKLIDADRRVAELEEQVMQWLFDPAKEEPRNDRVDGFRYAIRERRLDRVRYVGRTLLCPRRNHLEVIALPHSLRWFYFPLKWAHDLALPVWRLAMRGRVRPNL